MITKTGILKSDIYSLPSNKLKTYFSNKEFQSNCILQFPKGTLVYFIEQDPACYAGWYFDKVNDKSFYTLYSKETTDEIIDIKDFQIIKLSPGYDFYYKNSKFYYQITAPHSCWVCDNDLIKVTITKTDSGLAEISYVVKIKPENFI
jgi:hypothetical protein